MWLRTCYYTILQTRGTVSHSACCVHEGRRYLSASFGSKQEKTYSWMKCYIFQQIGLQPCCSLFWICPSNAIFIAFGQDFTLDWTMSLFILSLESQNAKHQLERAVLQGNTLQFEVPWPTHPESPTISWISPPKIGTPYFKSPIKLFVIRQRYLISKLFQIPVFSDPWEE